MFGPLMKRLSDSYALGNEDYPKNVEDAFEVLTLYAEGKGKENSKKRNRDMCKHKVIHFPGKLVPKINAVIDTCAKECVGQQKITCGAAGAEYSKDSMSGGGTRRNSD